MADSSREVPPAAGVLGPPQRPLAVHVVVMSTLMVLQVKSRKTPWGTESGPSSGPLGLVLTLALRSTMGGSTQALPDQSAPPPHETLKLELPPGMGLPFSVRVAVKLPGPLIATGAGPPLAPPKPVWGLVSIVTDTLVAKLVPQLTLAEQELPPTGISQPVAVTQPLGAGWGSLQKASP